MKKINLISIFILVLILIIPNTLAYINCTTSACPSGYTDNGEVCQGSTCIRNCTISVCTQDWTQVYSETGIGFNVAIADRFDRSGNYNPTDTTKCYNFTYQGSSTETDVDMAVDPVPSGDCDSEAIGGFWEGDPPSSTPWFSGMSNYIGNVGSGEIDYLMKVMRAHTEEDDDATYRSDARASGRIVCAPNSVACSGLGGLGCDTDCYNKNTLVNVYQGYFNQTGSADQTLYDDKECGNNLGGADDYVDTNRLDNTAYYVYASNTINQSNDQSCDRTHEAPSVSNVGVLPEIPNAGQDLLCNYTYSDPENFTEQNSSYEWWKNSVNQNINNQILNKNNLTPGDQWYCKVTPSDGLLFGTQVQSANTVTVRNATQNPVLYANNQAVWNNTGYYGVENNVYEFGDELNSALSSCTADAQGFCNISLKFSSDSVGLLNVSIESSIYYTETILATNQTDTTPPIVNTTLNVTLPRINDVVNISANITDETGLSTANITINFTTGTVKINFTLSGTTTQVSNASRLPDNCVGGCVVNYTVFATDTSNNVKQNSTVVTIVDNIVPVVNTTFNTSSPLMNDVINFTGNITDETGLLSANITYNISGILTKVDFTLSGTSAQISNVTRVCSSACVINFTMYATDTSNNVKQNSTLITVVDNIPPVVNTTFNITNPKINDVINFTGNLTDESGLLFGNITYNISGIITKINFTLLGLVGQVSNVTKVCSSPCVINFTMYATDTNNNVKQNSTLITVVDIIPPSFTTNPFNQTTTNQSVAVNWATDETANYTLTIGLCPSFTGTNSFSNSTFATTHTQSIAGLSNLTNYCVNITASDASFNRASANFSFRTAENQLTDTTPPTISNLINSTTTNQSVTITWSTNENANETNNLGLCPSHTGVFSNQNNTLSTFHVQSISALTNSTLYCFNTTACDSSSNCASSNFSFVTASTILPETIQGINVNNLSLLYDNSTLKIFEFRINNTGNSILSSINWTLNTSLDLILANNLISLQPSKGIFVFANYNYTQTGDFTVNATAKNGTNQDSEIIFVSIQSPTVQAAIDVYNLSLVYDNLTLKTFEFSINNSGNTSLNSTNWSLNTGLENILANSLISLQTSKRAFVFVAYNYTQGGDFTVNSTAKNGTNQDSEIIFVSIQSVLGGIDVYNLNVLNATDTKRVFEFDINNTLASNLTNVSWTFDTRNSYVINSTTASILQFAKPLFVFIDYNFTITGAFNVNATARNGTLIDSENLTIIIT